MIWLSAGCDQVVDRRLGDVHPVGAPGGDSVHHGGVGPAGVEHRVQVVDRHVRELGRPRLHDLVVGVDEVGGRPVVEVGERGQDDRAAVGVGDLDRRFEVGLDVGRVVGVGQRLPVPVELADLRLPVPVWITVTSGWKRETTHCSWWAHNAHAAGSRKSVPGLLHWSIARAVGEAAAGGRPVVDP